ncbi:hypothetical protein cyc_03069 [Cyclospora cayetanensis]|uniref:Uncharacterized protein n=1 Tax=Cyclospora cayetanensis TaxID=88456 RepID=A0A1D3D5H2_9EIME|nr:hypothetical protein cyc_03069 [Cyclospora cayetanensis]
MAKMGAALSRVVFQPPQYPGGPGTPPETSDLVTLTTKKGDTIHAFHIKGGGGTLTLLYSHGNAEDITLSRGYFQQLAAFCAVDVFLYEYVGSGPSVHLCALHPLGGLILQSALLSVHRVALRLRLSLPGDLFKNIEKIHKVECPVFSIHGTNDEIVPVAHGIELYKKARLRVSPFWVEGGGHNNLELLSRREFFFAMSRFLRLIHQRNQLQGHQQEQGHQQLAAPAAMANEA